MDGGLLVDKPTGPTSHDIVAQVRRALGTRRVGHAGTLDPMASGLLVVLVGEGTKLAAYFSGHDKRYRARVVLGIGTTTLDADGEVTERRALAEGVRICGGAPELAAALDAERARSAQVPPAHSAIKVAGLRSYALARKGESVELPPRQVCVHDLRVIEVGAAGSTPYVDVELFVSKGYYVRSFARDLGERLGVPAHLGALRRVASGSFRVEDALPLSAPPEALAGALLPLAKLADAAMPTARLQPDAVRRARAGQRLGSADFVEQPGRGLCAWLDPAGELVAIGRDQPGGSFSVERGFAVPERSREMPP